jgi:hypothetical protein
MAAFRSGKVAWTSEPARVENLVPQRSLRYEPDCRGCAPLPGDGPGHQRLDGAPILHAIRASVKHLAERRPSRAGLWLLEAVSDEEGKFVIENVPAMAVSLTVRSV